MAIPESRASDSHEPDRPQASPGAGSAQERSLHDGFSYDAFISYSRRNLDAADKIERDLEKFPLTREIRKRLGRRHLNVFRDVNDLTGNRLTPALEQNLEHSRTLVVLCSPAARSSTYVDMEINRFAELRDANKIVPVLIAGAPNNDRGADPAEWAFPDALSDALGDPPLAPDLRRAWGVERRKAKLARGSPWIQLVAGIVGVTPDDLTERIARAERRRLRSIFGVLVVILLVVSTLAVIAWYQRSEAVRQSLIATTRQLAATAQVRANTDLQSALLLADTAYRTHAEPETIQALHAVLTATPQLVAFYDFGEPLTMVDGTPDEAVLVGGTESGTVHRLDRSTGTATEVMRLDVPIEFLSISDDGKTIAAAGTRRDENGVREASAVWHDGKLILLPGKRLKAMSPSGHIVAMQFNGDTLEIVADGKRTSLIPTGPTDWVELPNDTVVVATGMSGQFIRATVDGASIETTELRIAMARGGGAISANGARFTYQSGYKRIAVFDLGGPLETRIVDATLTGLTGNPGGSNIALSYSGNRLATAADGSIFISDVRAGEPSASYTELQGAGPDPHSLRFLSDDVFLSASNSSAALWDLTKETPLATATVPAQIPSGCAMCQPRVIVSPDAGKALIMNDGGRSVVNLTTHYSRTVDRGETEIDQIFDALPAMVWLDSDRVFAYATTNGVGWILTGDQLDVIERKFSLPKVEGAVTRTVLRDDGTVVLVTEHGLVLVNPDTGEAEETKLNADAVTADGAYAVNFATENGRQNSTTVEIIDVSTRQVVKTVHVEGALAYFVEHTEGNLTLLRAAGGGTESGDTELLSVNPRDGTLASVKPLGTPVEPNASVYWGVSSSDALLVKETGEIRLYSLHDASGLRLIPIEHEFQEFNSLGLSRDGRTLIIASQPLGKVFRVPVTTEAWSALACKSAGRQLKPDELRSVVNSTDGLVPGCGSSAR